MDNLISTLCFIPGLVLGLTCHEFAHAWSASLLGDDFPRRKGRVSLNPFKHLSLLGTLAIFVIHFGWGKPVEINLYNFKKPKRDYLISSLAGPAANIIIAGIFTLIMFFTRKTYLFGSSGELWMRFADEIVLYTIIINILLAVLNLLPIPPLDGSKIWPCILPNTKPGFSPKTNMLFMLVLLALLYTNTLNPLFGKTVNTIMSVLPQSDYSKSAMLLSQAHEAIDNQQYEKSNQLLDQAIAINPNAYLNWNYKAYNYDQLGQTQQALQASQRALELNKTSPELHIFHAELLNDMGQTEQAQKYYNIADKLEKQQSQQ